MGSIKLSAVIPISSIDSFTEGALKYAQLFKALVLSGGEKQRLGIARAILKNASVIFADEPTASLDNSNRQLVVSLLKDCANRGAAIILATHDERLVAECDTVVRLGT